MVRGFFFVTNDASRLFKSGFIVRVRKSGQYTFAQTSARVECKLAHPRAMAPSTGFYVCMYVHLWFLAERNSLPESTYFSMHIRHYVLFRNVYIKRWHWRGSQYRIMNYSWASESACAAREAHMCNNITRSDLSHDLAFAKNAISAK